jgi:geranylgeranyl diphosphate synthase type I
MKEMVDRYIPEVDRSVASYFDAKTAFEKTAFISNNLRHLKEYCLRPGKRIRPLLVISAYEAYSGKNADNGVVDVAASAEVCHASFLVHDDIIDKAGTRRGLPSMDKLLSAEMKDSNNLTVGRDEGIVFGDLLIFAAIEMVSRADIDPGIKAAVLNETVLTYQRTAWGQALDIFYTKPSSITATDPVPAYISEMKTAYYTVSGPLLTGLQLSGRYTDAEAENIRLTALPLGTAFQLRDDLLGVFGREVEIGKSRDSDLAEGKYTLLVQKAVSLLGKEDQSLFVKLFSSQIHSAESLTVMRSLITESGAKEWCVDEAHRMIDLSRSRIASLSMPDSGKMFLLDLCDLVSDIPIM